MVGLMTTLRECADTAAAALAKKLRATPGKIDTAALADVIEEVLNQATNEREAGEQKRLVDLEASMQERLTRLLDASPAVIYSFQAKGDFAPIFVSANIEKLLGYAPLDYLDNPNFWRERVHPDDLPRVEAEVGELFKNGKHSLEYRFRRQDGSYCWVNDAQHMVHDEKGNPLEIVGSWSDSSDRKRAEEAEDALQARVAVLLESAPAVIYSFKATGDYAPTFVSENI
jgi:adenylate cyclase